jgi:hypothetical protein
MACGLSSRLICRSPFATALRCNPDTSAHDLRGAKMRSHDGIPAGGVDFTTEVSRASSNSNDDRPAAREHESQATMTSIASSDNNIQTGKHVRRRDDRIQTETHKSVFIRVSPHRAPSRTNEGERKGAARRALPLANAGPTRRGQAPRAAAVALENTNHRRRWRRSLHLMTTFKQTNTSTDAMTRSRQKTSESVFIRVSPHRVPSRANEGEREGAARRALPLANSGPTRRGWAVW